jgi:hypothetical protein
MANLPEAWYHALSRLRRRKGAYAGIPHDVLVDLARFCRAHESCYNPDPRIHALLEGRREVWLRIQQHAGLTGEQLMALYRATVTQEGTDQ